MCGKFKFCFSELPKTFFPNTFNLWLVEFTVATLTNIEGHCMHVDILWYLSIYRTAVFPVNNQWQIFCRTLEEVNDFGKTNNEDDSYMCLKQVTMET